MTITRAILWILGGVVVVYLVLLLLMTPVRATSGSGEGNILTTQSP
jgi:hypothetical protein